MTILSLLLVLAGAALLVLAVFQPSRQRITLLALCVASSALGLLVLWLAARARPGRAGLSRVSDPHISPFPPADEPRGPDPGEVDTPSWPLRSPTIQEPGEDRSPA